MLDKIYIGVIIALLIIGGTLFTQVKIKENRILGLTIERDNLKSAIKVKSLELDNAKTATETVEELLTKEKESANRLEKELEILKNEPEENNGSVSPLLRNGIERLHDN